MYLGSFPYDQEKLSSMMQRQREPKSIPCQKCGKHIPVRALKDINIRGDKVFCDKCARRLQSASKKMSARAKK